MTASATAAWAGTYGKVVAIGGHAADLALDEGRGVLYVANFTANRVDVMSLADNSIRTSINVPSQPSSLALSPDGGYLLVAHYGNFAAPQSSLNALTVINLNSGNAKRTFALGSPPLGVAFGIDGKALVATSTDILLFDPVLGTGTLLDTIQGLTTKTLPQPVPAPPTTITAASMAASRDGLSIFAITDTIRIGYDVNSQQLYVGGYIAQPPMGPRTISVSDDGSTFAAGWALFTGRSNDASIMTIRSQFPNPTGDLDLGSQAIDSSRGVIYAQIPDATGAMPALTLQVVDSDNLSVIQRFKLAENLAGKSVLSSDYSTLYSISESGVTVFPIGAMLQAPTLTASVEDVLFRGSYCDRKVATQQVLITDASGGNVDFTLTPSDSGVRVSPSRGTTPARVTVSVDPNAYQNQTGTTAATIAISSNKAVNAPAPIRVLINTRNPDQVGDIYSVPGSLVDLLADPSRERIYVLRQDKNQVLVFDTNTYTQIASLKTGNTPTSLAITFDRRYLLVGSDNSQLLYVYDLDTLEAQYPIQMPFGHYPRSVAASANAILAASRVAGAVNTIDRVDLYSRTATALPSLGVYANSIALGTTLTASPNGSSILVAEPDGTTMLYNANADTFTVGRKSTVVGGAYAASNYDQFVVGSNLLNSSLVPMQSLDSGTGTSSGFTFIDQDGLYVTAPSASAAGVLERVSSDSSTGIHPTRMVEAPVLPSTAMPFTRTVAAPYTRTSIIILSTSGFTVVPWNFDTAVAPPQIEQIVNAADFSQPVAPGGLISLFGTNLSPVTENSQQTPLPTILGNSCLTVNGQPVPMIYVSGNQINAQLPNAASGNTTVVLRSPGGVSDNYNLTISAAAPSVFRAQLPGMSSATPVVIRADNNQMVTPSNPVHRGDTLVIYATGLGLTTPAVDPGSPAPYDPLATLVIQPSVTLGGVPLQIDFAGLTPGYVGVYQINVEVKNKVTPGWTVPLVIDQGSGVTFIDVRVVQ